MPLVRSLDQAGFFHLWLPRSMGGPEVDPITSFRIIEEISRVDGSVGWCAMLSVMGTLFAGWLSADVGKSMFGEPPEARIAESFRALGEAKSVDGGYLVSGRWDYASGVNHANWLALSCKVMDSKAASA